MIRSFCTLLILCFSYPLLIGQTAGLAHGKIILGVTDSLYSEVLQEQRTLWVYVPATARADKTFPVLYLLDGNAHFYSVAGMYRQLAEVNGNTIAPETIIVGIPNTNRARDLTPSAVPYLRTSGGADRFTSFMRNELIPYIEKQYNATSYRTLMGHSWGGLFVLNTLVKQPDLFDNYVSIDPTIRWDNLSFLKQAKAVLAEKDFERKSLFLGVANRLPKGRDLSSVVSDSTKASEHMRKMLEFAEAAAQAKGLNFEWQFYPDDHHLSVPLIAGYDATRFLFPWHSFNEEILFDPDLDMNGEAFARLVEEHFKNVSDHFGYEVLPTERLVNRLGDASLSQGDFDKALALYQLNTVNYPASAAAHDALGDGYAAQGNTAQAIGHFRKSLSLEETPRVRNKLERLLQPKN